MMSSKTNKMLPFQRKKNIDLTLNAELSTNKLTPGILKIFGNHVSPGSNYKAVRVSTISTALEVVREALEKFNLERCDPQDFVLCDVIGQFTSPALERSNSESTEKPKKKQKNKKSDKNEDPNAEKPVWVTEYVRAINEVEKPLVLQSLWKPTNGKARRFELRNRIELANSFFFLNNADSEDSRSPSDSSLLNGSINSNGANSDSNPHEHSKIPKSPSASDTSSQSHHLSLRYSRRQLETNAGVAPVFDPYLLMLKGCHIKDKLVHRLQDPTIIVGPHAASDKKECDIVLYSADIILPHCWLYKKVKLDEKQAETNFDDLRYLVFIEPANGADVTVDGKFITSTTMLRPGELITLGNDYLFMFKDPTRVKDSNIKLPWLEHIKNSHNPYVTEFLPNKPIMEPEYATIAKRRSTRDKCIQVEILSESNSSANQNDFETGDDTDVSASSDLDDDKRHLNEKTIAKSVLQLSYNIKDEDDLLHSIIDIADGDVGPFKLIPAYFFIMAIEHSAANFTDIQTRKLLLKISSGLQGIAWEKTKEIGKVGTVKNEETMSLHNRLLPELKPVLFWLTNSLQMLHYLQCNLKKYLLPREDVKSTQNAVVTADEELLSILEEVIMFTFQQIVYHLTKILYGALPAVLEVNPFQVVDDEDDEDEDTKRAHPAISKITRIFSDVLTATHEHQIHPQIISQVFAYLFFFCNALLFNSLSEKGPTSKIFRWAKGVQIRGNIDIIEEWSQVNGLGNEFDEYLGKFTSAVSLLSTPKVQLMQFEWNQMRIDYPLLNPAQLQLILGEYQLNGKQKPRGWYPSPDEVEAALKSSDVLESFATHPPLMLPSSNFILDLNESPQSEEFFSYLNVLHDRFDKDLEDINVEEIIQPKSRSDHPMTIPILEIKPIPPPHMTILASSTDTAVQHDTKVRHSEITPATTLETPNSNTAVLNSTEEDIIVEKISDLNMEAPSPGIDIHTTAYVNQSEVVTLLNAKEEHIDNEDNDDYEVMPVNLVQKPPRSSIDLDPNFADDFKDIQERNNTTNIDNTVAHVETTNIPIINDNQDASISVNGHNDNGDVYFVELLRENNVLGLGLIDGQFTPLKNNGIYIRTIVPNTPAATDKRLRIGDRILSVNGNDVLDKDYAYAMGLIKTSGVKISLIISVSSEEIINQIMAVA